MAGQAVYASSKASVSIITECLAAQFSHAASTALPATIFLPGRRRPQDGHLELRPQSARGAAREKPSGQPEDLMGEFMKHAEATGMEIQFQDLDELAQR